MRKIIGLILLIVSINSFGQNPANYQYRVVYERLRGIMTDSVLHVPRYNGVPSGLRGGSSTHDGAIAADTLNNKLYLYSGGGWIDITGGTSGKFGHASGDYSAAENRAFNLHHTYSFNFDSVNTWGVFRSSINRLYVNSISSGLFSPNGQNSIQVSDAVARLDAGTGSNYLWMLSDSALLHKRISYEGNIHSTFFPYSLVDKSYVDSVVGTGGIPTLQQVLTAGSTMTTFNTIVGGSNGTLWTGSANQPVIAFQNTNANGEVMNLIGGTNGYGLTTNAPGASGIRINRDGVFNSNAPYLLELHRTYSGGNGGNGIGSTIAQYAENSAGGESLSSEISSYLSTATSGSETSMLDIKLGSAGSYNIAMNIQPLGIVRVNNNTDTLATLADVRAGGGGGGISAADLPLRVTGSTVSADTSVPYVPSLTTNARLQKIIDSLSAAGWGANNIQYEPWYTHYLTTTGGNAQSEGFYGTYSGANASILNFGASAATVPDGWMYGQQMSTGTTAAGWCYHYGPGVPGGSYGQISINSSFRYNYGEKVRLEDLSDGTETYAYYCGFIDDVTSFGAVVDGAGFRYAHTDSSGAWIMWTKSNSTLTEDATTTTVAADTDYELEISIIGGTAYYYINKVLAGSISTNVPSGSTRNTTLGNSFEKSAGTTARSIYIEWMAYGKRRT